MCEFSANLVAWIDGELPPPQAAGIERHLAHCSQCRSCVAELRKVSQELHDYCDEVLKTRDRFPLRRSAPVLCAVAAVAAGVLALASAFVSHRRRPSAPPPTEIAAVNSSPSVPRPMPADPTTIFASRAHTARPRAVLHTPARKPTVGISPSSTGCSQPCVAAKNPAPVSAAAANDAPVQIAIPAESVFPPGAVPEGMSFVAEVRLGADGNVQQLELRPELWSLRKRSN